MLTFPRWQIIGICLICLWGVLAAAPNFLSSDQLEELPDFLPNKQVNLGLDLQGGAHLLLAVDLEPVIQDRLETVLDDVRQTLLREQPRISITAPSIEGQSVVFTLRDPADRDEALRRLRDIAQQVTNSIIGTSLPDLNIEIDDETGNARITLTEEGVTQRRSQIVQQSLEVVRKRIDELGTREPVIQRQGSDRILVQVPGLEDSSSLKEILNTEAQLSLHLVDDSYDGGRIRPGYIQMPYANAEGAPAAFEVIKRRPDLTGDRLVDAQPGFSPESGQPIVTFRFDVAGGKRFAELTRQNVNRRFAIVLDDEVLSAPVIQEPILGGSGRISGNFTVESATNLAVLLRAGALPAKLTILEERTVGPDLGADSIAAGKLAAIIGLVGVLAYIVLSYGRFGLAANAALLINIALLFGLLSTLQATLTLPGIAGIVLTIGMAVDANVLVFERIREEVAGRKNPLQAVESGYQQAMSTILDANITTLIAAVLLFQFGSGPVRGFAVTLGLGIITSVFTAVVVTRLILSVWLRRSRPKTLPI